MVLAVSRTASWVSCLTYKDNCTWPFLLISIITNYKWALGRTLKQEPLLCARLRLITRKLSAATRQLNYTSHPIESTCYCIFRGGDIRSGAWMESAGSHVSSLGAYPFYWIRNWSFLFLPKYRWLQIDSTSYSSSPPIRSGGGWEKFGPCEGVSL